MSSDTPITQILGRISLKCDQLRTNGFRDDDKKILNLTHRGQPSRFELSWRNDDFEGANSAWSRKSRACQLYTKVRDADSHLFLAFVLTISPTDCAQKVVGNTVDFLCKLNNYESYHFQLDPKFKAFFESTAEEHSVATNDRYIKFIRVLFPPNVDILADLRSPEDHSPHVHSPECLSRGDHSTVPPVLPRSLKRKGAPTDCENPELASGTTESLSPDRSDTRQFLDVRHDSTRTQAALSNVSPFISANKTALAVAQDERVYELAPLQNLGQVFDRHISSAIARVIDKTDGVWKAAVTMVFPSWALVDCLMSFDVVASKVESLAMALFNIRVETVENVRYVIMKGGVRLQPNPAINLKGVTDSQIIEVFGPWMHGAIIACRMREKELEAGIDATDCVSMEFTTNPNEGATINLALGMYKGTQTRKKLYTRM